MLALRCAVPYSMEGLLRRELQHAGAVLGEVTHGDAVEFAFSVAERTRRIDGTSQRGRPGRTALAGVTAGRANASRTSRSASPLGLAIR